MSGVSSHGHIVGFRAWASRCLSAPRAGPLEVPPGRGGRAGWETQLLLLPTKYFAAREAEKWLWLLVFPLWQLRQPPSGGCLLGCWGRPRSQGQNLLSMGFPCPTRTCPDVAALIGPPFIIVMRILFLMCFPEPSCG